MNAVQLDDVSFNTMLASSVPRCPTNTVSRSKKGDAGSRGFCESEKAATKSGSNSSKQHKNAKAKKGNSNSGNNSSVPERRTTSSSYKLLLSSGYDGAMSRLMSDHIRDLAALKEETGELLQNITTSSESGGNFPFEARRDAITSLTRRERLLASAALGFETLKSNIEQVIQKLDKEKISLEGPVTHQHLINEFDGNGNMPSESGSLMLNEQSTSSSPRRLSFLQLPPVRDRALSEDKLALGKACGRSGMGDRCCCSAPGSSVLRESLEQTESLLLGHIERSKVLFQSMLELWSMVVAMAGSICLMGDFPLCLESQKLIGEVLTRTSMPVGLLLNNPGAMSSTATGASSTSVDQTMTDSCLGEGVSVSSCDKQQNEESSTFSNGGDGVMRCNRAVDSLFPSISGGASETLRRHSEADSSFRSKLPHPTGRPHSNSSIPIDELHKYGFQSSSILTTPGPPTSLSTATPGDAGSATSSFDPAFKRLLSFPYVDIDRLLVTSLPLVGSLEPRLEIMKAAMLSSNNTGILKVTEGLDGVPVVDVRPAWLTKSKVKEALSHCPLATPKDNGGSGGWTPPSPLSHPSNPTTTTSWQTHTCDASHFAEDRKHLVPGKSHLEWNLYGVSFMAANPKCIPTGLIVSNAFCTSAIPVLEGARIRIGAKFTKNQLQSNRNASDLQISEPSTKHSHTSGDSSPGTGDLSGSDKSESNSTSTPFSLDQVQVSVRLTCSHPVELEFSIVAVLFQEPEEGTTVASVNYLTPIIHDFSRCPWSPESVIGNLPNLWNTELDCLSFAVLLHKASQQPLSSVLSDPELAVCGQTNRDPLSGANETGTDLQCPNGPPPSDMDSRIACTNRAATTGEDEDFDFDQTSTTPNGSQNSDAIRTHTDGTMTFNQRNNNSSRQANHNGISLSQWEVGSTSADDLLMDEALAAHGIPDLNTTSVREWRSNGWDTQASDEYGYQCGVEGHQHHQSLMTSSTGVEASSDGQLNDEPHVNKIGDKPPLPSLSSLANGLQVSQFFSPRGAFRNVEQDSDIFCDDSGIGSPMEALRTPGSGSLEMMNSFLAAISSVQP